jgi:hypothetical protein
MWHIEILRDGVWVRDLRGPVETHVAIGYVRYIHNAKARAVWVEDEVIRLYKD